MANCACRTREAAQVRPGGFTLLEVLIALAIVAIALGALVAAAGAQTRNDAYLEDKTFAHWVAMNRAAELQLQPEASAGSKTGSEQMAQRTWFWKSTVAATEDPDVQRATIEIRTAAADEQPLFTLIAFVYRPVAQP